MTTSLLALSLLLPLAAAATASSSSASPAPHVADASLKSRFDRWLAAHGKSYAAPPPSDGDVLGSEYARRLSVFAENDAVVSAHNDAHRLGLTSYSMSMDGPFADLTDEEFGRMYLMEPQNCSATHASSGPVSRARPSEPLPSWVDWRTKGVVTPVKAQGKCGSCWTFSTTGALEAHTCLAGHRDCTRWSGLSEQQLVDCAGAFDNDGCGGGLPSHAFEYIRYSGGIATEDSYAYTAEDGACRRLRPGDVGARVGGVFNITPYDEGEIVKAVAEVGPVSVAFQVAPDFRLYSNGVYDSFNATANRTVCGSDAQHVNHAVVAVGYGETRFPTMPFHIIRNSWGNTWGMEGYFWILRGENLCGISDCASFPLVVPTDGTAGRGRGQYLRAEHGSGVTAA